MLTEDMIGLIGRNPIGTVATIAEDGGPAASPKATFIVIDDRTLGFAHIRSPVTVANLLRDPRTKVVFTDPFRRTGCRVRGRATYVGRDDADPGVLAAMRERWPDLAPLVRGVVTIQCEHAEMLASPSYDAGAKVEDLVDTWMRRFADDLGYEVRRR